MTKRIISVTLALIMIFGIIIVPSVNADDIKILTSKTIKVGYTADVSLTDPDTGAKLNTVWTSNNPSIATVTSDGTVKGVKAGKCVVYTTWNSKLYGVDITVTGSSSSTAKTTTKTTAKTKTKTTAFQKLKNYLIKSGTTQTNSSGEKIYYKKWENKKYRYWFNYNSSVKYIEYAGVIRRNSTTDNGYLKFFQYESQNKLTASFAWTKNGTKTNVGYYSKDYKKSKFNIKNKIKLKHQSGKKFSNVNTLANKYRKIFYPKWDKHLKEKVRVSLKSLGLMYSKAKKVSINKKSATLIKGKTLKLKLKNAKASKVKWSSSKKKIASVSKKGVVKAKKKGKATITAKYKGKKYKCKITVKAKAKKKVNYFTKLKNYLKKKGKEKFTEGAGHYFEVKWSTHRAVYDATDNSIHFYNESKSGSDSKAVALGFYNENTATVNYNEFGDKIGGCSVTFKKSSLTKSCNLNFKVDEYNEYSASQIKSIAKTALKSSMTAWNKYIKSKAKVSMKQLGFTKW